MDSSAHFHLDFNSCPLAAGYRTNRHDSLGAILRHLCGFAKRPYRSRYDTTVNFDNVPKPSVKIMDATVDNPHNGSTFFVDFHILDSLARSHLHIQKPGGPASQSLVCSGE